jgi:hypothetical protein
MGIQHHTHALKHKGAFLTLLWDRMGHWEAVSALKMLDLPFKIPIYTRNMLYLGHIRVKYAPTKSDFWHENPH